MFHVEHVRKVRNILRGTPGEKLEMFHVEQWEKTSMNDSHGTLEES